MNSTPNGPPKEVGPDATNVRANIQADLTPLDSPNYSRRWRPLPQEAHADLGIVDDGQAVGS
jgi:hypothetical protein